LNFLALATGEFGTSSMENKKPSCHPERRYYAKGLCGKCYWKKYNTETDNRCEYGRKWYHDHGGKRIKKSYELKRYGMSIEEFELLLESQNSKCAICEKGFGEGRREGACVDHCHETGNVRGLLCFLCNVSIGGFRDDPETVMKAAAYLERHKNK